MSEAQFALITLGVMFAASNIYWAWHSHLLINKLMSRNYGEFKQASVTTDRPAKKNVDLPFDDMGSMSEFN